MLYTLEGRKILYFKGGEGLKHDFPLILITSDGNLIFYDSRFADGSTATIEFG